MALAWTMLAAALPAAAQTCSYNPNQPNAASFGTIDTTVTTPRTFTIALNYKCSGNPLVTVTVTGANDAGPGAYRMQNQARPTEFMSYTVSITNDTGAKLTLNGLLPAASFQNASAGDYVDRLSVLVMP